MFDFDDPGVAENQEERCKVNKVANKTCSKADQNRIE